MPDYTVRLTIWTILSAGLHGPPVRRTICSGGLDAGLDGTPVRFTLNSPAYNFNEKPKKSAKKDVDRSHADGNAGLHGPPNYFIRRGPNSPAFRLVRRTV